MATRLDSRRYVLLYGDVELGEVTHQDSDFPNCSGTWRPYPHADNPEIRSFIRAYVEFCDHADSLLTPAHHLTQASEAYTLEREPEFEDLIESTDWALRDEDGVRDGILVPTFSVGGKVGWRWHCMTREEMHIHDTCVTEQQQRFGGCDARRVEDRCASSFGHIRGQKSFSHPGCEVRLLFYPCVRSESEAGMGPDAWSRFCHGDF